MNQGRRDELFEKEDSFRKPIMQTSDDMSFSQDHGLEGIGSADSEGVENVDGYFGKEFGFLTELSLQILSLEMDYSRRLFTSFEVDPVEPMIMVHLPNGELVTEEESTVEASKSFSEGETQERSLSRQPSFNLGGIAPIPQMEHTETSNKVSIPLKLPIRRLRSSRYPRRSTRISLRKINAEKENLHSA